MLDNDFWVKFQQAETKRHLDFAESQANLIQRDSMGQPFLTVNGTFETAKPRDNLGQQINYCAPAKPFFQQNALGSQFPGEQARAHLALFNVG